MEVAPAVFTTRVEVIKGFEFIIIIFLIKKKKTSIENSREFMSS